jgi:hypothetical protein
MARQKRKEVEASVPARIKSSGLVARTSLGMLQKSVGDVWSRISSANALQKERPGSSEQGPSSAALPAGETVGDRSAKRRIASSNSPMKEGEDRDKAQGGERSPSSGCTIAKSGEAVAGPGLSWPPNPTKSPCRWKASRIITRHRLSRDGDNGGLGSFRAPQ